MALFNAGMAIRRRPCFNIILLVNVLFCLLLLVQACGEVALTWFGRAYPWPEDSALICFVIVFAMTSLFFLPRDDNRVAKIDGKDVSLATPRAANGALYVLVFLILNLGLLFSSSLLKIAIFLVLLDILELWVLSHTNAPEKSALKELALSKLFSTTTILIASVFIIIARDSVNLLEGHVQNYDLYYLGVCFFTIYVLGTMHIIPFEEIRKKNLFNADSFLVICSMLGKFVVSGVVLITTLKGLILAMRPLAQERMLEGLEVIMVIAMVVLILRAMQQKRNQEIIYYLFCANNILALLTIYSNDDSYRGAVFSLLTLSALGLSLGIYMMRNGHLFVGKRWRPWAVTCYFLAIMSTWGMPSTAIFKMRYWFVEQVFSMDTAILLIILIMVSGLLWVPVVLALCQSISRQLPARRMPAITTAEGIGILLVSVQIIVLNYSNILMNLVHE